MVIVVASEGADLHNENKMIYGKRQSKQLLLPAPRALIYIMKIRWSMVIVVASEGADLHNEYKMIYGKRQSPGANFQKTSARKSQRNLLRKNILSGLFFSTCGGGCFPGAIFWHLPRGFHFRV